MALSDLRQDVTQDFNPNEDEDEDSNSLFDFDDKSNEDDSGSDDAGDHVEDMLGARSRADTFVGTVNYQSPEVIKGKAHTFGLDVWALGNILFKMLVGTVPFQGTNPV